MPFLSCEKITIRKRQREVDPKTVGQLKDSIRTKGLLHAPVIGTDAEAASCTINIEIQWIVPPTGG